MHIARQHPAIMMKQALQLFRYLPAITRNPKLTIIVLVVHPSPAALFDKVHSYQINATRKYPLQSPGDRLRSRAPQAKIVRFGDPLSAISKAKTVIFRITFGSHSLPPRENTPLNLGPNPLKGYFLVALI